MIRTVQEEYQRIVQEEAKSMQDQIEMMVEAKTETMGSGMAQEQKIELVMQALKANLTNKAIANTLDSIVEWINSHEKWHDDEEYKNQLK